MNPIQSVLITGANAGLGREAARQLAMQKGVAKIYLACRNRTKAEVARAALEHETGRKIFDIVLMDVTDPASVRAAVADLSTPIDAVILNAGGTGGRTPNSLTGAGVTNIFATNVLGHVVLVDALLERQLVTSTVLYAGSEAARGIPKMGMQRPDLSEGSVEEFRSIADGSKFGPEGDPMQTYGYAKLVATLWMGAMARQHPHIRFVTMSPGGTAGTAGFDDLPLVKRIIFKHVGGVLMPLFGMMHSVEAGAKRYLDGLLNPEFKTGRFYASKAGYPTGPVVDQASIDATLSDTTTQDNANQALRQLA
ncbi:SDR family NAD(P)-dependent oxidoreductase [Tropicibacter sp. R16_0]|uniref:SDR family NAD(P)-dependent oxidoreductase n=1 Tax=Tropicibacter sp. R16_0 TaxID=2821102 RepID=UPI001AD9B5DA|nr:SDR family NAD(P)-dependent oxidoreductase [Tropicibacter sp. R16_0]MBO9449849.1 SDR family NAD(P)-dependent oxidoreductase [Tropicibacter sp. R16_0]